MGDTPYIILVSILYHYLPASFTLQVFYTVGKSCIIKTMMVIAVISRSKKVMHGCCLETYH